ncbi:branched-chain amino acid ABC transporter permease [Candidatus Woesearchaeota archaeon]|nr:branched-chain amino acid ABC transporter permease [Candidatus Woesearchaeota archaeon]
MAFEAYLIHLAILIGIYSILSISLNLAIGFTGLLNIGHVAFYGIGAYTSALLALNFGIPFWFGLLIGGLVASFFGLLLAIPTIKLKGDYLAIATLGFAIIIENIFRNWTSLTRGPLGLPGIPKPQLFGFTFSGFYFLILILIFVLITYLIIKHLVNSPYGRVLKAIREDELAASSLGKNVVRYKTQALIISAFFAGIAGSLYAHYITFIDPSSFSIMESILMISMIIVGGLASVEGSIVGAIILILLPEPLRFLPLPSFAIGSLRQMIYAGILIFLLIKRPQGFLGEKLKGEKNVAGS